MNQLDQQTEQKMKILKVVKEIESNLLSYSLYYAEACNEFAGPIFASLRSDNTASFEEMLQQRQAVANTVSNLSDLRFKPQTSHSRDNMLLLDQLAGSLKRYGSKSVLLKK